jgi:hypothetical protein
MLAVWHSDASRVAVFHVFHHCLFQVNHHFRRNNSMYKEIEHPRWGTIQVYDLIAISRLKPIQLAFL